MRKKRQPWILGFLLLIFAWTSSCGEPIPVDCATEEEWTTENEGGFETGTVAGIAAGGAAVAVLAGGAISGGGESSGGSGGGTNGSSETVPSKESMDTSPDTVSTVLPTYATEPSEGDVITGTSVLKVTFNKSVTGMSTTNVVLKDANGITVTMDYAAPKLGNTYTFDPNPDLTSGSYYLSIGEGPIVDSDGQSVTASIIEFRVEDALTTGRAAMEAAGLSSTIIIAADNAAAAVTNNLLSVIPAAMSAGIVAASTSAAKSTVISSLLGTVNGAASLTSTADRTITRISDTTNFTTLLLLISDLLVRQAAVGNLTAAELGSAVTTVIDSLDDAGADTDQAASFQATFNSAITTDLVVYSLSAEYITAVTDGEDVLEDTDASFSRVNTEILQAKCMMCHMDGGLAGGTPLTYANPSSSKHEVINYSVVVNYFSAADGNKEKFLQKAQGGGAHGGGAIINSSSTEFQLLQSWIDSLETPQISTILR